MDIASELLASIKEHGAELNVDGNPIVKPTTVTFSTTGSDDDREAGRHATDPLPSSKESPAEKGDVGRDDTTSEYPARIEELKIEITDEGDVDRTARGGARCSKLV